MLITPNGINVRTLEKRMKNYTSSALNIEMSNCWPQKCMIIIPKIRIETELHLNDVLKKIHTYIRKHRPTQKFLELLKIERTPRFFDEIKYKTLLLRYKFEQKQFFSFFEKYKNQKNLPFFKLNKAKNHKTFTK